MKLNDELLTNGIRLITVRNENLHSLDIGFYFKGGILYEPKRLNGITHFLEHLFFRRLYHLPQRELYKQVNMIGGILSGKTYDNFIRFDLKTSPKYFEKAFCLMSYFLKDFNWTEEDFEIEKKVVLNQIVMNHSSYNDYLEKMYYHGTRLSMPIMGSVESIANITLDDINLFKTKIFNPKNLCCVLTGNIGEKDYINAKNILSEYPKKSNQINSKKNIFPRAFHNRTIKSDVINLLEEDDALSDVAIVFETILTEENKNLCLLLSSILGEGDGSRLSLVLKDELCLTDEIYSTVYIDHNIIRFVIEYSVQSKDLLVSLSKVIDIIKNIKQDITIEDFQTNIVFFTENRDFCFDDVCELNFQIGWNCFILSHSLNNIVKISEYYHLVTQEKLIDFAKQLFQASNLSFNISCNDKVFRKKEISDYINNLRNHL